MPSKLVLMRKTSAIIWGWSLPSGTPIGGRPPFMSCSLTAAALSKSSIAVSRSASVATTTAANVASRDATGAANEETDEFTEELSALSVFSAFILFDSVRYKVSKCPSRQLTDSSRPWHTPPAKLGGHQNFPATNPTRAVGPIPPNPVPPSVQVEVRARSARESHKRRSTPPTHCSRADSDRLPAQLHSRYAARPHSRPPESQQVQSQQPRALARVPRMECERTISLRSIASGSLPYRLPATG